MNILNALCNNYGYKYRGGLHYSKRGRIKSIKLLVILFFTDPSLVGEILRLNNQNLPLNSNNNCNYYIKPKV